MDPIIIIIIIMIIIIIIIIIMFILKVGQVIQEPRRPTRPELIPVSVKHEANESIAITSHTGGVAARPGWDAS